MPKFLCLQRSIESTNDAQTSPSQMQDMYARFMAWQTKFEANLVDMGGKLGEGTLVTAPGASDGPFVEVKELVGGYMIVSADSLDEAVEVASECPGLLGPRSGVEVIEIRTP